MYKALMIAIRYKSMIALCLKATPKVKFYLTCDLLAAILSVNENRSIIATCALYLRMNISLVKR